MEGRHKGTGSGMAHTEKLRTVMMMRPHFPWKYIFSLHYCDRSVVTYEDSPGPWRSEEIQRSEVCFITTSMKNPGWKHIRYSCPTIHERRFTRKEKWPRLQKHTVCIVDCRYLTTLYFYEHHNPITTHCSPIPKSTHETVRVDMTKTR